MIKVDLEALRQQLHQGLPQQVRWEVEETPWDLDFSRAATPLRTLQDGEIYGEVPAAWRNLWIFGEDDFAEGGGANCQYVIDGADGRILCLETEMDSLVPWNSDAGRFIKSFALVDRLMRQKDITPEAAADAVRAIDPEVYESSRWSQLLGHLADLAA